MIIFSSCDSRCVSIPLNQVVYVQDYEEMTYSDFIKKKGNVLYVYIDSNCSACIHELSWWCEFVEKHNLLVPVFIFNYLHNDLKPFIVYVRDVLKVNYPVIQDMNYRFKMENALEEEVIVANNKGILFKGDPNDRAFYEFYHNLKNNNL